MIPMEVLLDIHSILRYVVVLLVLIVLLKSLVGWLGNHQFTGLDRKLSLFMTSSFHLQFLVGIVLFFMSPTVSKGLESMGDAMKNQILRFWTVEHTSMMLIAVVLATIANAQAKRAKTARSKFKRLFIFMLIVSVLLYLAIPWPWAAVPRTWF